VDLILKVIAEFPPYLQYMEQMHASLLIVGEKTALKATKFLIQIQTASIAESAFFYKMLAPESCWIKVLQPGRICSTNNCLHVVLHRCYSFITSEKSKLSYKEFWRLLILLWEISNVLKYSIETFTIVFIVVATQCLSKNEKQKNPYRNRLFFSH
jgi:hypothetical protein